jgi:Meiotically up-regulated gene 113
MSRFETINTNLCQDKISKTYYVRAKINGKQLFKSLNTKEIEVAEIRQQSKIRGFKMQGTKRKSPISLWVYVVKFREFYKIGYTTEIGKRLYDLDRSLPCNLEKVYIYQTNSSKILESQLHKDFRNKRIKGEWFILSDSDIEKIKNDKKYKYDDGCIYGDENYIKNELKKLDNF